jgi:cathepsin B
MKFFGLLFSSLGNYLPRSVSAVIYPLFMANMRPLVLLSLFVLFIGTSLAQQQQTTVLPTAWDPRVSNPGCLSKIVSQGQCGSCWAISGATTLSDRHCLAGATDINSVADVQLSFQEPLTCVTSLTSGCNGGYMVAAWRYFYNKGVTTCTGQCGSGCWPYKSSACTPSKDTGLNGCSTCPANPICNDRSVMHRFAASTYGQITPHSGLSQEVAMMHEIYTNGPIQVCFTVYDSFYSFFRQYPNGIYTTPSGASLGGHCVKIIGWGEEQGLKYWIVANSWGTSWGDKGYFKVARGIDLSGFETWVYAGCPANSPTACQLTFPVVGAATASGNDTEVEISDEGALLSGGWTEINQTNPLVQDFIRQALADAEAKKPGAHFQVVSVFVQAVEGLNFKLRVRTSNSVKRSEDEMEIEAHQNHLDGHLDIVH